MLVEDDASIRHSLRATLSALRFVVGEATTGEDALAAMRKIDYDAVLLDLNMPGMGGMVACHRIRKEFPGVSILVVTVRDSERDKIEALDAGADDYITKPFRINELTARIRAAVRRRRIPHILSQENIRVGVFELAPARRILFKRGSEVHLTPTEFDLLSVLMTQPGTPIPHAKLLSSVWGVQYGEEREYLRTFILQLRRKLEDDPANPEYLQTVSYLGYVFVNPSKSLA